MAVIEKKQPVPLMAPTEFLAGSNYNDIPITLSKWIVRSYRSYLITGDQGSGKSTYLKSIARFYEPWIGIRVNEMQPELNLRYAYPNRNIVEFYETPSISTQDGLNFQKKTSGTVNIIGEIASAEAASWWVQTTKVASKSGAGTHHGKTIDDTVTAIRDNIMKVDHYSNADSVEIMVADALDYDIHMSRDGFRFIERITEVLPVKQREYPYPNLKAVSEADMTMALRINQLEYFKRVTDRKNYEEKNICEYDRDEKRYMFTSMFSDSQIKEIKKNLTKPEYELFEKDMDRLMTYNPNA